MSLQDYTAERDDQNLSEIRIKSGKIRAIYYRFTYPNDEQNNYEFFLIERKHGGRITGCNEELGLVHMNLECSRDSSRITEYHVLLIDTSKNVNGTNITCNYRLNSRQFACRNSTSDLSFVVMVYNEGNDLSFCTSYEAFIFIGSTESPTVSASTKSITPGSVIDLQNSTIGGKQS